MGGAGQCSDHKFLQPSSGAHHDVRPVDRDAVLIQWGERLFHPRNCIVKGQNPHLHPTQCKAAAIRSRIAVSFQLPFTNLLTALIVRFRCTRRNTLVPADLTGSALKSLGLNNISASGHDAVHLTVAGTTP